MFRTELNPIPSKVKIDLQKPILLVGSCFSDSIGEILVENKFDALPNPFGVVYNPLSIFNLLENTILEKKYENISFVEQNEIWYNYHFHSDISALTKEKLATKITEKISRVGEYFAKENITLIITLGTAFVYSLIKEDVIVANCHKMPASLFEKQLLSPKQIIKAFEKLYGILPPNMTVILTVSPVRHIKDSIPLNAVSKSVLRIVCHELSEQFENVSYFPAYEYLIDDLRDYRFYEADMLHPNRQAIDYVFAKFGETYFDTATQTFLKKWKQIHKSLHHRAFHSETKTHQQFLRNLLLQLQAITEVNVSREIDFVSKQLNPS